MKKLSQMTEDEISDLAHDVYMAWNAGDISRKKALALLSDERFDQNEDALIWKGMIWEKEHLGVIG